MNDVLLLSPYLIGIGLSWSVAHVIKYILAVSGYQDRVSFVRQMFISGGMPSSHAATTVAVWTLLWLYEGLQSAVFGLATLVVLIVCYDAVKVRRSSGEQGEAIQKLIKEQDSRVALPRLAKGHTPVEVIVGAVLGVLIGLVVFFTTK